MLEDKHCIAASSALTALTVGPLIQDLQEGPHGGPWPGAAEKVQVSAIWISGAVGPLNRTEFGILLGQGGFNQVVVDGIKPNGSMKHLTIN